MLYVLIHIVPLLLTLAGCFAYVLGCVALGVYFKHVAPNRDATDTDAGT